MNIDWSVAIPLLITFIGMIGGIVYNQQTVKNLQLQLQNQKKVDEEKNAIERDKAENDETKVITDAAIGMVGQIKSLTERMAGLETENCNLYQKLNQVIKENEDLKNKISVFERALLESPVYRIFFDTTHFACLITNTATGKIFDSNKSFEDLYGYSKPELSTMTIYDLSLQRDETEKSITDKSSKVERIYRNKNGQGFLVDIYANYYRIDGTEYGLYLHIPKVKTSLASRVRDLLDEILTFYGSDYATLWCIHNHGKNKLSELYESVKHGNAYLLQDYKNMPSTMFEELFSYLKENKFILIDNNEKIDIKFEPIRLILRHSGLNNILFTGIFYNENIVGMLSTSWRGSADLDQEKINKLIKYSESELLCDAVRQEIEK
jgi:PAS domain-containing protein